MNKLHYLAIMLSAFTHEENKHRELKVMKKRSVEEIYKIKGLKEFKFGDVRVWALNLKNAKRKFKKMNKTP